MKKRRLTTDGLIKYIDAVSGYYPDDGEDYSCPPYKPCDPGVNALRSMIDAHPGITPAQMWAIAGEQTARSDLDLLWLLDPLPATRARGVAGVIRDARNRTGEPLGELTNRNVVLHVPFADAEAQLIDEAVNTLGLSIDDIAEEVEVDDETEPQREEVATC